MKHKIGASARPLITIMTTVPVLLTMFLEGTCEWPFYDETTD
jgi:hypothetical protein